MLSVIGQAELRRWGGMLAEETVEIAARVGQAVAESQDDIFSQAQSDVPVLTGRLKGTIRKTGRAPLRRRVKAGGARAFYARFQEFGVKHHSAQPFLITHANRPNRDRFEREVWVAVQAGHIYR